MPRSVDPTWLGHRLTRLSLAALFVVSPVLAQVCALPGRDGPPPALPGDGIVNSYYTPAPGTLGAGLQGGSLSLSSKRGASAAIAEGDLVVLVQMQCADISSANSLAYGSGTAGGVASPGNAAATGTNAAHGYTDPGGTCRAGQYDFVRAGAGSSDTSLNLAGNTLANTYVQAAATASAGRRSFQVIRVPQYSNLSLTPATTITAPAWNGASGGVVVLDVAGQLDWGGGRIEVSGLGFRGGQTVRRSINDNSSGLPPFALLEEFVGPGTTRHAGKGEGIAGTPSNLPGGDGYPGGSFARGAPGNAGGGGVALRHCCRDNGGGGGGSNGGEGGRGGTGWANGAGGPPPTPRTANTYYWADTSLYGFGGAPFSQRAVSRLVMGGGGGAGDVNDGGSTGTPEIEAYGGNGGGIVMVRAGSMTGTGTINANGADGADNPSNDAGGGAGAGGSVLVLSQSGAVGTLTVSARGGTGGDSFPPANTGAHGPGGGGGGGVIFSNGSVTANVAGGSGGVTNTSQGNSSDHGARGGGGLLGALSATLSDDITGAAGARCLQSLNTIKSAGTPSLVSTTGPGLVYDVPIRVVVGNTGSSGTLLNVQVSDNLSLSFPTASAIAVSGLSVSGNSGATCSANAAFNGTSNLGLLQGNNSLGAGQSCSISFTARVTYNPASSLPATPQNNRVYASSTPTGPNPGHTFPGGTPTAPAGATATDVSTTTTHPAAPAGLPTPAAPDSPSPTPITFTPPAGISGTLFRDNNLNGTYQAGTDTPLPSGISVQLVDDQGTSATADDVVVQTVQTDASGFYSFVGVAPGSNYGVRVVGSDPEIPAGSVATAPSSAAYSGITVSAGASLTRDFGYQNVAVDVVKSAGAPLQVSATVFEVPFVVTVGSTGAQTAPNVQVSENLGRAFASGSPTVALEGSPALAVSPSAGATCTPNSAFNGTSVFGLLAGTDDLAPGQSCTISFRVRLTYATASSIPTTAQNNQVFSSSRPDSAGATNPGHTFPGGTPTPPAGALTSDASSSTANPATPASLPSTPGGDTPAPTAVTFVPNPGNITGTLYLDRNLNSTFNDGSDPRMGAGVTMELLSGGSTIASTTTDADGNYRFNNVDPGSYTVRVVTTDPDLRGATPSAPASGTLAMAVNPGATTANQNFGFVRAALDVIKSAGAARQINTTTFEVTYTVVAGNTGTAALSNLQLSENLGLTFAAGSPALSVSGLRQTGGSATCTVNPAFNGSSDFRLLVGTDGMAVGQNCTLSFTVRVVYTDVASRPDTAQNNTVYGSSTPAGPNPGHTFPGGTPTAPAGATATDASSNTANPALPQGLPSAPNGDSPSATPVTFAQNLGSISGTLYNDLNGNRSFDGTPQDRRLGAGLTVELVDGSGAVTATATTDGNGDYSFNAVAPGTYTVRVPTNPTNSNNPGLGTLQPVTSATINGVTIQPGTVTNNRNFGFNSPPVADNDSATTPFNTPVTLSATTGDVDPDGFVDASSTDLDPGTAGEQKTRTTPEGTWAVDASGNVTFTPRSDFSGIATLPYTVRDNTGNLSNQAELRVTVQPAQPPVAAGDTGATLPDTNVTLDPKLNDSTPNRGATLTPGSIVFPAAGQPAGAIIGGDAKSIRIPGEGLYTTGPAGDITFDPDPAFLGTATPIFYSIQDSTGQTSNPASVTIRVRSPAAVDDNATTPFATAVNLNPLTNDRVAAGATLVPASVVFPVADQPAGAVRSADGKRLEMPGQGVYVIDPVTGVVNFTPAAGFTGNATPVKYTVDDSTTSSSLPANIRITVGPPVAPTANPDTATTPFGTPVNLTPSTNDTSGPGTSVVPGSIDLDPSTPGQETVREVPGQGRFELNPSTGVVTFTPVPGFAGTVQVPYTLKDSLGQTSAPSTLTVNVTPPPAPVARDDSKAGDFNTTVDVPAVLNDSSSPNTTLVPGSIDLDPSTPAQETSRTVPGKGTFTVQPDGTVRFVPEPGFEGTAVVPYTIKDSLGQTSNPANISVTIRPRPAPPVARDDRASTPRGLPVTLEAIANDSANLPNILDPNSIDLDPSTPGRQTSYTVPGRGTFTLGTGNEAGKVIFTPVAGFTGVVTTPYTISDNLGQPSNPANLTVTVTPLPAAVDDRVRTPLNTPVDIAIAGNDATNPGQTIQPSTADLDPSTPGQQTSRDVPGQGTFELQPDGSVRFTPATGFVGMVSIPYTVQDSQGATSSPANIVVTVTPPPPTANDDSARTPFNTPVTLNPNTNDSAGAGGQLLPGRIDLDPSTPGQQTRLEVPGQGVFVLQPATNLVNESVQFVPATGFTGTVSIPYTIGDNFGQTSNPANLTVTVNPPGAPIASNDLTSTRRDTPVSLNPVLNDTAGAGTNLVASTIDLDPGTDGQQTRLEIPGQGTFELQPDGSVRFTPATGFTGTVQAPYTIKDALGQTSNTAKLVVTINPLPAAANDSANTPFNTPVTLNPLANDTPAAGATFTPSSLDLDPLTPGIQDSLSVPGKGTFTRDDQGNVRFVPVDGFTGTVTIPYTVQDSSGGTTNTATIAVTVIPPAAPVAANDEARTPYNTPVTLNPAANDRAGSGGTLVPGSIDLDPATPGQQTSLNVPNKGTFTLNPDGTVTFTPVDGFVGTAEIPYTIRDNAGQSSNPATIRVEVTGPRLTLSKQAVQGVARTGGSLEYILIAKNEGAGVPIRQVTIEDLLPVGLEYRAASSTLDGVRIADPQVSSAGGRQRLVWIIGDLAAGQEVRVRFATTVTAAAPASGQLTNTASATGQIGSSLNPIRVDSTTASAIVRLEPGVFSNNGTVVGRVYLDKNGDNNFTGGTDEPLPGVRVYLSDGRYAVTDAQGRYSLPEVAPGTSTLRVDLLTVPYRPKSLPDNRGLPGTRQVRVEGAGIYTEDFLFEAPQAAAQVTRSTRVTVDGQRLEKTITQVSANTYTVTLTLTLTQAVTNLRITDPLPTNSSRGPVNAQGLQPAVQGNTLSLGNLRPGTYTITYTLTGDVPIDRAVTDPDMNWEGVR